jgi:glutathione S-transferase
VRYLAAAYDSGGLWPWEPKHRAIADQWTDWTATRFQSAWLAVFEMIVRVPETARDQIRIEGARAEANRLYSRLDSALSDRPYLAGERFSYADIVAGVSMHRWMTMPNERLPMPHLEAWYARLVARPAFTKAVQISYADMFGVPVPTAPP